jgi:hypothetical protein
MAPVCKRTEVEWWTVAPGGPAGAAAAGLPFARSPLGPPSQRPDVLA